MDLCGLESAKITLEYYYSRTCYDRDESKSINLLLELDIILQRKSCQADLHNRKYDGDIGICSTKSL
jgi:hypothetical protein